MSLSNRATFFFKNLCVGNTIVLIWQSARSSEFKCISITNANFVEKKSLDLNVT